MRGQNWEILDSKMGEVYEAILKMGQGGYGQVWKVKEKESSTIYALKRVHDAFRNATDAQRAYRQIKYLQRLCHPNVIKLISFSLADNYKDIYLTLQFMDYDLNTAIRHGILKPIQKHFIFYQIANGVQYLHSAHLLHRDLKPSNILLNQNCQAKICDFGLVRSLVPPQPNREVVMTENIATRWYRAPEILLCSNNYGKAIDIWGLGCVLAELFLGKPLFQGSSAVAQLQKIFQVIGKPSRQELHFIRSEASKSIVQSMRVEKTKSIREIFQKEDKNLVDLLQKIFVINPSQRITIEKIMEHPFVNLFKGVAQEIKSTETIKILYDDRLLNPDNYRMLLQNELEQSSSWKKSQAERSVPSTYNDSVVTQSLPNNSRHQFFGNRDVFGCLSRFSPQRQQKNLQPAYQNFQSPNIVHYVKQQPSEMRSTSKRKDETNIEKSRKKTDVDCYAKIKQFMMNPLIRLQSPQNRNSRPIGQPCRSRSPGQLLSYQSIVKVSLQKVQRMRRNIRDDKVFGRLCFENHHISSKNISQLKSYSPLKNKSLSPGSGFDEKCTQMSHEPILNRVQTTLGYLKKQKMVPSFIRNRAKYKSNSPESQSQNKLSVRQGKVGSNQEQTSSNLKQRRFLSGKFPKFVPSQVRNSRRGVGSPKWGKQPRF